VLNGKSVNVVQTSGIKEVNIETYLNMYMSLNVVVIACSLKDVDLKSIVIIVLKFYKFLYIGIVHT